MIIAVSYCYLSSSEKGLKNSGLNSNLNPNLCHDRALLLNLSYQANWKLVILGVDYKPVDDGHRYTVV